MKLAAYEGKKLLSLPILWIFLALCLAFNGLLLGTHLSGRDFFQSVSATAQALGQRVDSAFLAALAQQPQTEHQEVLAEAVQGMTNVYEDYDLTALSDFYQEYLSSSPTAARWMAQKYQRLAQRADHLAETGAAMDLYAGPATHDSHQFLFGTLLRAVVGEGAILGMLCALYLLGYEGLHRTQALVWSSRTGRRLIRRKVAVSVVLAVALYLLLALVTLAVYFALWDYRGLWGASVSSQFNYLVDLLLRRPFFTWADFTLAGYLAAFLALGAGLTGACALLAALTGCLIQNTYLAALALMLLCLLPLAAEMACAQGNLWMAYYLLGIHPVCLWLSCNGWFTELGLSALLPWQETLDLALALLLLAAALWAALRYVQRKDLV